MHFTTNNSERDTFLFYILKMAGYCLLAQSDMYRHVQLSLYEQLDGK